MALYKLTFYKKFLIAFQFHSTASLKDVKPRNWCLTEDYLQYLRRPADGGEWVPDVEYYGRIVERMVQSWLISMCFIFVEGLEQFRDSCVFYHF